MRGCMMTDTCKGCNGDEWYDEVTAQWVFYEHTCGKR